ncbi:MAG: hypothetical protein JXA24_03755 [Proteobacteria bacterium]|nr:hypothetical protein [Pseudomonadota bacterium]
MTAEEMKRILALLALLALAGCGADPWQGSGGGALAVTVKNAASFDPAAEHGRIVSYRVSVSGEGIEEPIVALFDGGADGGVVAGVPVGEGRTVAVEAVNPNEAVIRAGESFGVKVGGGLTEVEVEMEAVPIFTNIAEGNAVDNTRLLFRIFSDPSNPVVVHEISHGADTALVDASTSLAELYLDESTGMGRFAPALMEPGRRSFEVRDLVSGRSSAASVLVLDGTRRRPAPLVAATGAERDVVLCSAPWCAPW